MAVSAIARQSEDKIIRQAYQRRKDDIYFHNVELAKHLQIAEQATRRAEQDRQRAEQDRQRAEQSNRRAEQSDRRAEELQVEIEQLRQQLALLQTNSK